MAMLNNQRVTMVNMAKKPDLETEMGDLPI